MKSILLFLFFLTTFTKTVEVSEFLPTSKKYFKAENKTINDALEKENTKAAISSKESISSSEVLIVDPLKLAKDWVEAFNILTQKKINNVLFLIQNHPPIENVISISPLTEGYLMVFTTRTNKGYDYKIVRTSSILSIETK